MNKTWNPLLGSLFVFLLFVIFTFLVINVDVAPIGPQNSSVGLATINQYVFDKIGVNPIWYDITGVLGIVALLMAFGFSLLGLIQLVQRRSIFKLDRDLVLLGIFYLVVMAFYFLFEVKIINYRPVILQQDLEASYPSTHTLLAFCIMVSSMFQFKRRIKNQLLRRAALIISGTVFILTVGGRLISGVHWFSDIVAGLLLGSALVLLYFAAIKWVEETWPRSDSSETAKNN